MLPRLNSNGTEDLYLEHTAGSILKMLRNLACAMSVSEYTETISYTQPFRTIPCDINFILILGNMVFPK